MKHSDDGWPSLLCFKEWVLAHTSCMSELSARVHNSASQSVIFVFQESGISTDLREDPGREFIEGGIEGGKYLDFLHPETKSDMGRKSYYCGNRRTGNRAPQSF